MAMEMNHKHKTYMPTKEEAEKKLTWLLFDATDKTLGRFASEVAKILRGKHKVDFTPHVDTGDGVIIINAEKIKVTGEKEARKTYRYYTGHIGGLREVDYRTMKQKNPTYILEHAIKKMMPRTKLGRKQLKKLRIFVGNEHKMEAQNPIVVNI